MTSATIPGLDTAPTKHRGLLAWVQEVAELTQPDRVVFADGSEEEYQRLCAHLVEAGNRSLSVTPAVTLPIFDSGRLRANLAASEAGGDIAIEQYNAALVDGLHEVADALASARSLETQQAEQRAAQASAEEALRLANLRYREGLSNYLTVLSAQTEVLAQRRLGATLRTRRVDAALALLECSHLRATPHWCQQAELGYLLAVDFEGARRVRVLMSNSGYRSAPIDALQRVLSIWARRIWPK